MSLTPDILAQFPTPHQPKPTKPRAQIWRYAACVAIGAGVAFVICQPSRYSISTGAGRTMKLDRWTGQTWTLSPSGFWIATQE